MKEGNLTIKTVSDSNIKKEQGLMKKVEESNKKLQGTKREWMKVTRK